MRRSVIVIVFIIILGGLAYYSGGYINNLIPKMFSVLLSLSVLSIGVVIFLENRHPSNTVAWILLLALIPVVGFVFYLLFGQNYRKRRRFDRKAIQDKEVHRSIDQLTTRQRAELEELTQNQQKLLHLSHKISDSVISFSTNTKILTNGEETFAAILQELEKAVHHIHMEYYIYRDDAIGTQIKDILVEKARAGVEVRFLYDAVGSYKLPFSFLEEMRRAGIEVVPFEPVRFPFLSSSVNYRNHRKIVVIDGNVGFMGGLNVGDEYLSRNKTYGFWRDTHMFVKGEAVHSLQAIFVQDWFYMTGKAHVSAEYFRPEPEPEADGAVQIIASGPDNKRKSMKHLFFSMITSARKSIWIATPYFIPDEDILTALRVAALSGIEVKILFPAKPDRWMPFLASHSYFSGLIESGVDIYEYEKGFLHSKILIIDGETASIGTANMDMRSFHLNFEVNALLFGTDSVQTMVSDFKRDLKYTNLINPEKFARRKVIVRFLESAARLFSPLL
ncbi:putative cardiolipin synthase YwiE [Paenibacillus sp. CECT 9249]|nr:putative cardiolipin synthase YwiE [Paenibacillus sp. CECT 9249]